MLPEITVHGGAERPARSREHDLYLRLEGPAANVRLEFDDLQDRFWRVIPPRWVDLLHIACYVFAADQAMSRGSSAAVEDLGRSWRRSFRFRIPVHDIAFWRRSCVTELLTQALSFLSEDRYAFDFRPRDGRVVTQKRIDFPSDCFGGRIEEVILFSGGLDSLAGAAQEVQGDRKNVILVNHRSTPKLVSRHERLLHEFRVGVTGPPPVHLAVRVNEEVSINQEFTQRTRSFLFTTLGAIVARMVRLDRLRLYENGVISINLPLAENVLGSRASRTTHPRSLRLLGELLGEVAETPFRLENPFIWCTKAEIVGSLARHSVASLIGSTVSCGRTMARSNAHPHCGVCSQCIDRRLAVLATRLEAYDPEDGYAVALFVGERDRAAEQVTLAAYVETCRQIAAMSAPDFFRKYGEIGRALNEFDLPAERAAEAIFDLHRRHATQVRSTLERGVELHAGRFLDRDLPDTCLIRLMEPADRPEWTVPAAPPAPRSLPANYFLRQGDYWRARFAGGEEILLIHQTGNDYLRLLVSRPGHEFSATDLAQVSRPGFDPKTLGTRGQTIDEAARRAYRVRLSDLEDLIENANESGDADSLERHHAEMQSILRQLGEGEGLGGRLREQSDLERVRKAVGTAIRRAIGSIRKYDSRLADHLVLPNLRVGTTLCYDPRPTVNWVTD